MKVKDLFLTANANMFRSKLRTGLTVLAIFIGAFTLTLTSGIGLGISNYIEKQVGTIGQKDVMRITIKSSDANLVTDNGLEEYVPGKTTSSNAMSSFVSGGVLTENDINALKAIDDLTDVRPVYMVSPDYIEGSSGVKYKLTSSPVGGIAKLDLAAGSQLDSSTTNQIVLPGQYVLPLGYSNNEDILNKQVTIAISDAFGKQHTVQATVVGIQQAGLVSTSGAAFNRAFTDELYNIQSDGLPEAASNKYIMASVKIKENLTDTHIQDVKDKLDKLGYKAQTSDDTLGLFESVINAITWVLNSFAIIALLAASFGIVNTLLMSVQERTKEIGLMKAMGMSSSRIFSLFSIEAVLIGFWGSAFGVTLAIGLGEFINYRLSVGILKDLPGFDLLAFSTMSVIEIILLIMAIAFIAGTLPARKAAKQNPIDALRYE